MRVLLIGKHNMLNWLEHTAEAFALEENVEVETLEVNRLGWGEDLMRNIVKRVAKAPASQMVRRAIEKRIRRSSPDLILVISPFLLDAGVTEALESVPASTVRIGWVGDRFGARHKEAAGRFDLLYGTDSSFIDAAADLGFPPMRYLPLAVNERLFYDRGLTRMEEVLFIGAPTPGRVKTLNAIDAVDVRVVGKGWRRGGIGGGVRCEERTVGIDAVADAYNRAAYVLNVKHEHNVLNGLNMRSFEAPACGACLLQDDVTDVVRNFDPGEEIVVYASAEELNATLAGLRNDYPRYDKIRQNGYRRVMAEHTFRHRVAAILSGIH